MGLVFDVYAAAAPNGSLLATLTDATQKQCAISLDGTGSGTFSLPRSSAQATSSIIAQGNLVKVRLTEVSANPITSFWMDTGRFDLIGSNEAGSEMLTFGGSGARSYLGRAIMWSQTFLAGETGPVDGQWLLYNGLNGSKAGAILRRLIAEAISVTRPQQPLPSLSFDFTYTLDTTGATWSATSASSEFIAHVGDSLDAVIAALQSAVPSLVIQMDANLGLHAYNSFGVDRHSATFASGKVRLQKGINIATSLTRELGASQIKSHMLVAGDPGFFGTASNALTPVREGFASSAGVDTTALNAIAAGQLALRSASADSIRVGIPYGNTPTTTGLYYPGPVGTSGHYWVGDSITVHTGATLPDYNESTQRIVEIALGETESGDVIVEVALGSTYSGSDLARIHDVITEQRTDVQQLSNEALRYAHSLITPKVVTSLPALPDPTFPLGSIVFLTTDTKLYRNADGSTWSVAVDGADVVAGTIIAGALAVGAVTAEALAATIILGTLIETAGSGRRVEMDTDGIRLFDGSGGLLVNIPTDGSPVYVSGQITASSLVVTGNAELQGAGNSLGKGSSTTAQAGVQPPSAPPSLVSGWPAGVSLAAPSLTNYRISGGYYDAAGGTSGATACWVALVADLDNNLVKVYEWTLSTGAVNRITTLSGTGVPTTFGAATASITRIPGAAFWYATMTVGANSRLRKYARGTGVATATDLAIGTAGAGVMYPITNDGTSLWLYYNVSQTVLAYDTSLAFISSTSLVGMPSHTTSDLFLHKDIGAGARFWIGSGGSGLIYEFTVAGALVANTSFPAARAQGTGYGFIWDGTQFQHAAWVAGGAATPVSMYTSWTWTTASAIYWVSYAWLDSAGTTHETSVSPRQSITMGRRQQLTVGNAAIPIGGADDPNQVRVYMVNGASDPGPTNYHLQSTDALTTRALLTYASGGAADGGGTPFVGGLGAILQSAGTGWILRGNGSMNLGGSAFPGAPVTNDHYFRTDIGLDFAYDGSRWLSDLITDAIGPNETAQPWSATTAFRWGGWQGEPGATDIWVVSFDTTFFVAAGGTALGASHLWQTDAAGMLGAYALTTARIDSGASAAWRSIRQASGVLLGSTEVGLSFTVTKVGTPGTLRQITRINYRLVAT